MEAKSQKRLSLDTNVLFDLGDGRAVISPDGNWNQDPEPLTPALSYMEAFEFLSRCSIAPRF